MDRLVVPIECRASTGGPKLHGILITEGRAATGGRAELFVPGAVDWPAAGIAIRSVHLGAVETRAVPSRNGNAIHIEADATPALFAAVLAGAKYMNVEFHALAEQRTVAGVREVLSALVTGAIVTDNPEYEQTAAEVRTADADDDSARRLL